MYNKNIWLYLKFPLLALETVLIYQSELSSDKPLAIINSHKNVRRIVCCNDASKQWGVEPELSLTTALAICPDLVTFTENYSQEKLLLQQLALIAYRFSPEVIIDTAGLWLEISSCEHLFNGYENLLKQLHEQLLQQKINVVNGIGENPLAAKLTCSNEFQKTVPKKCEIHRNLMATRLDNLPSTPKQQRSFKQLGLNTIQDLLKLPRCALSQRFDQVLMDTLGLLVGEKTFTGDRFRPPQSFYNEVQNPQGLYSKESLLFPMKTLLQQFCQYLAVLQCHSLQLEWTFEPLLGKHQKIILSLSGSNNSWSNFLNLSRLKLERIDLPQSIERISLSSNKFIDMPDLNVDLFNNQFDLNKEEKGLIDNLSARLGLEALSKLVISNEYLPEKASTLEPIHQNLDSKYIISKSYKPIWLLAEPSPAKWYKKQLYWGKPLKILSGPERLCSNWWQSEQKRDYYLVSDSEGSRYWIFRELLSNQWFVHGVFA